MENTSSAQLPKKTNLEEYDLVVPTQRNLPTDTTLLVDGGWTAA
jgi:hypothetical protein